MNYLLQMDCIRNYMVNIKLHECLFILVCGLFSVSACAQSLYTYSHLGNGGKKFTPASEMSNKDWDHPDELERVWQASLVRVPDQEGKLIQTRIAEFNSTSLEIKKKYPTVIYLHGCSGIWAGTIRRINFLAKNGFAVIAPPSFVRAKYPRSCSVYEQAGGMYRDTIKMRQNDAGNAIEKAKNLAWVDENNMFLMGLSEGGITAATFFSKSRHF